jgi:hypothetical protein
MEASGQARRGFIDVTLHTLSHFFAYGAADLGYSEPTITAMIGHAAGSVTGRYTPSISSMRS